ncbi:MAG TPA: hypothetical protein VIH99_06605 [Bdellovibrionota bacterium]|jgi:hypothetical protein
MFKATALLAALFALSLPSFADDSTEAGESLDLDSEGGAWINDTSYVEGTTGKPADLHAEVVKAMEGPEGSTILYLRPTEARKTVGGEETKVSLTAEPRAMVVRDDWKMFDAEHQPTSDPQFASSVIIPYPMESADAAMFEVVWNECEGAIQGNYVGTKCRSKEFLADDYMAFMKKNYLNCVNAGMANAGLAPAVKIHIMHDGTAGDMSHKRTPSLHNAGRAIDLQTLTTTDKDGKKNVFNFRSTSPSHALSSRCTPAATPTCKVFEGFRSCWHKLHVARKCPPRAKGAPIGTLGWEDKKHVAHHLHTSMPFCPSRQGHYITQTK